jgi:hypothetical protein
METGRLVMEYCLNAVWLVPVVAGAAWLVVSLVLPALGIGRAPVSSAPQSDSMQVIEELPVAEMTRLPVAIQPIAAVPEGLHAPPAPSQPSRKDWLKRRLQRVSVSATAAGWFGWLYAGMMGLAAVRLVRVWWSAVQLVRDASPYAMDEIDAAVWQEFGVKFGVRLPRVLRSERVKSPVVVGTWRTVLLLPVRFETCSEAERRAAICHELAHLARRDCLVHSGVRLLMAPLIWHPAAHWVGRRIARTREMVCDEMAARAMSSSAGEIVYARCLLNLARTNDARGR